MFLRYMYICIYYIFVCTGMATAFNGNSNVNNAQYRYVLASFTPTHTALALVFLLVLVHHLHHWRHCLPGAVGGLGADGVTRHPEPKETGEHGQNLDA